MSVGNLNTLWRRWPRPWPTSTRHKGPISPASSTPWASSAQWSHFGSSFTLRGSRTSKQSWPPARAGSLRRRRRDRDPRRGIPQRIEAPDAANGLHPPFACSQVPRPGGRDSRATPHGRARGRLPSTAPPLPAEFRRDITETRDVSAGVREVRHEPVPDRVDTVRHHDFSEEASRQRGMRLSGSGFSDQREFKQTCHSAARWGLRTRVRLSRAQETASRFLPKFCHVLLRLRSKER